MPILTDIVSRRFSGKWHYAIVVLVTSVVALWQLGKDPLDGHEAYVASSARNMADRDYWLNPDVADGPVPPNNLLNHWTIPVFNGRPRLVKTPLAYWCVAVLIKLGLAADEFTARLPSALASVALAVLVLALGRSLFSTRAALLGALMLSTSLAYVSWGRNARADLQMTFWMSLAMACVFWAFGRSGTRKRHLLLLAAWGALGLANLGKQMVPLFMLLPIGLGLCWRASVASVEDEAARRNLIRYLIVAGAGYVACVLVRITPFLQWWWVAGLSEGMGMAITIAVTIGGPAVWYAIGSKAWRRANAVLPTALPGVVILLALFVPWMMYIADIFPQARQVYEKQTADRVLGTEGWLERSAAPLTAYYVRALAKWSLPWVVFLPGALAIPLMKRFREDRDSLVFLFLWVFALVLLFSVSVGKHEQYIIPALPAACLLMGYCAEDVFFKHRWLSLRLGRRILAGYGLVILGTAMAAAIALAVVEHDARPFAVHVLIIANLALVPGWLALALVRTRTAVALAMMVIAAILAEMGYFTLANPWGTKWDNYARMGRRIRNEVPPGDKIVALGNPDAALVWYAGRDLPAARLIEARLVRMHGNDDGQRLWRQWTQADRPLWAIDCDRETDGFAGVRLDPVGSAVPVNDRELMLFRWRTSPAGDPPPHGAHSGGTTER